MEREHLASRLGFILLSAGCAIGIGNVWKFPWMAGQYGGAAFVVIYLLFLVIMGVPVLTMEFAMGRAAQKSPLKMYGELTPGDKKWGWHGYVCLLGNIVLMMFYTTVSGWMLQYFVNTAMGVFEGMDTAAVDAAFFGMLANPVKMTVYMGIVVAAGFGVISFGIQKGLERVTKWMMLALIVLMLVLAGNSVFLEGGADGLKFYLVPDLQRLVDSGVWNVIVGAMNQSFFTLSLGIGSMAIFGSYIGKERSLMGESVNIILLDTFVAITAGLIIFPACFTYDLEVTAGPGLLFDTMATVFNNMNGGRVWGTVFFLFMVFASMSTVLAVFENILACTRELTGWSRPKGSILCAILVILMSSTTALGYSVIKFQPFAEGSAWLDLWDFLVSTNLLPLGSLAFAVFCCNKRYGWGWDKFIAEANTGKGLKVQPWMKPLFTYVVPCAIILLYIIGLVNFPWH